MQITIGTKSFEGEPYLTDQRFRKQGTDPTATDPLGSEEFAFINQRSITAVDYRLIQAERKKIYEYNCLTRRGDTFDLDVSGRLVVQPVIFYIVQKRGYHSGSKLHPYWELNLKKAKALADKFRNEAGLPTKMGMSDPNAGVDAALRKLGGLAKIRPNWKRKANRLIPDVSFTVFVDVEFAYYRLNYGDYNKGEYVIVGLPRQVTPLFKITYVCRAETVGDIKKVGEEKAKKPITVGLPAGYPEAIEMRKGYDKALAEHAEAVAKKKARSKIDKLKDQKRRLERDMEWTKKRLQEIEEILKED